MPPGPLPALSQALRPSALCRLLTNRRRAAGACGRLLLRSTVECPAPAVLPRLGPLAPGWPIQEAAACAGCMPPVGTTDYQAPHCSPLPHLPQAAGGPLVQLLPAPSPALLPAAVWRLLEVPAQPLPAPLPALPRPVAPPPLQAAGPAQLRLPGQQPHFRLLPAQARVSRLHVLPAPTVLRRCVVARAALCHRLPAAWPVRLLRQPAELAAAGWQAPAAGAPPRPGPPAPGVPARVRPLSRRLPPVQWQAWQRFLSVPPWASLTSPGLPPVCARRTSR